jgi:ACT domain-containing protein
MPINGDGILVTLEKSLDPFNGISSTVATIRYYENKKHQIVYTIDKNLMNRVSFSIRDGILNIGFSRGGHTHYPTVFNVDVYSPKLTSIHTGDNSGSANSHLNGHFSSEDTIITSTMDLSIEGKGIIDISIECDDLSAHINNNNGEINIIGSSRNANITVNGDGIFNGKEFTVNNAVIHIIRIGKVWICVKDFLKATTDDRLARIYYRGDPEIDGTGVHPAQALLKF